jgi:hypothetical protein
VKLSLFKNNRCLPKIIILKNRVYFFNILFLEFILWFMKYLNIYLFKYLYVYIFETTIKKENEFSKLKPILSLSLWPFLHSLGPCPPLSLYAYDIWAPSVRTHHLPSPSFGCSCVCLGVRCASRRSFTKRARAVPIAPAQLSRPAPRLPCPLSFPSA